MGRRPFRTRRSLLVSAGLLMVVAFVLGIVVRGGGVGFDPQVAAESSTSATLAPTTGSDSLPSTSTRPPGPVARAIQWINAYAPLGGGATGTEDVAFAMMVDGECQDVLTLSEATTFGDRLAEPARSLYEGAAAACLAAFAGRQELWPRPEAAYARLGGQIGS